MQNALLAQRIGALVRQLRVTAGWSQEEFADQCGLHRTYMGAIERGEKSITVTTAERLCRALKISLSQFFDVLESEGSEQSKDDPHETKKRPRQKLAGP